MYVSKGSQYYANYSLVGYFSANVSVLLVDSDRPSRRLEFQKAEPVRKPNEPIVSARTVRTAEEINSLRSTKLVSNKDNTCHKSLSSTVYETVVLESINRNKIL